MFWILFLFSDRRLSAVLLSFLNTLVVAISLTALFPFYDSAFSASLHCAVGADSPQKTKPKSSRDGFAVGGYRLAFLSVILSLKTAAPMLRITVIINLIQKNVPTGTFLLAYRRLKNAKKFAFFLTPLALHTLKQSDFFNGSPLFALNSVDVSKKAKQ